MENNITSQAIAEKLIEGYSRELDRIAGRVAEIVRYPSPLSAAQIVELIKLRKEGRRLSEAVRISFSYVGCNNVKGE